jgi:alkanesulfonate monooxygenase SsuD/methylene tetrahydromethanopterin reductase-like flavin-dependent oxidoreductase (luciferase family)
LIRRTAWCASLDLDHLTGGSGGTLLPPTVRMNKAMGLKEMVPHEERYERADEFIEVL